MAPNPTIYCLEQLTDYAEFERLCDDLMALEGYPEIEPLGGFKDKGRDAVHVSPRDGKVTIFAYSVREDWWAKLAEDAEKIHRHGHNCNRVVFITTSNVTPSERDKVVSFIAEQYGWELDLYDSERLRILLEITHPGVRSNHPQIFPPSFMAALDQVTHAGKRDHILVHYAREDRALAEWLARKLTAEGYLVWCEHLRSLGRERYPDSIDDAIQNRARCLVSLYSQSSLANPDISRQRAIASTLDRQYPHFLIPLRLETMPPDMLDQVTRGLVFLPFETDWAEGLRLLLDRLVASGCPKVLPNGPGIASQTFTGSELLSHESENLVSNCLRILYLPKTIFQFTPMRLIPPEMLEDLKRMWAFRNLHDGSCLSFHRPPDSVVQEYQIRQSNSWSWHKRTSIKGIVTSNLVSELISKSMRVKCFQKGLQYCQETKMIYFPDGLVEGDKIKYEQPRGRRSWVNTVGERKYPRGKKERYHYSLSPYFSVSQSLTDGFIVLVRTRVRVTDTTGVPLPTRTSLSRRKHLCMNWWNREWLNRMLAICQFLSEGGLITIGVGKAEQIVVSSQPIVIASTEGINEQALNPDSYKREDLLYLQDDEEEEPTDGVETLE